jgi:hypothetical protein
MEHEVPDLFDYEAEAKLLKKTPIADRFKLLDRNYAAWKNRFPREAEIYLKRIRTSWL